jgi:hypothetical protein
MIFESNDYFVHSSNGLQTLRRFGTRIFRSVAAQCTLGAFIAKSPRLRVSATSFIIIIILASDLGV